LLSVAKPGPDNRNRPTAALLHQRRRRGICDREDESHPLACGPEQALYWRDRSQLETGKGWGNARGRAVRSLGAVVQEYTSERLRRVKCRGLAPIFNRFGHCPVLPRLATNAHRMGGASHPQQAPWRPAPYGTVSLHEGLDGVSADRLHDVNYFICKIRFPSPARGT